MAAKDFLVNTDYPLDKVIFIESGSTTLAALGSYDVYTNHSLGLLPLMKGVWSFNSNFSNSFDMSNPLYADSGSVNIQVSSSNTQYRIVANNNSASSKTVYWRIYGVMDTNDASDVAFTNTQDDDFILNTDYNYTKLFLSGAVDISSASQNVSHLLGYKPQVDVWFEAAGISGEYIPLTLGVSNDGGVYNSVLITDTQLQFLKGSLAGQPSLYKYRVYIDD